MCIRYWSSDVCSSDRTKDVGGAFLAIFPTIVRRRMGLAWTSEERQRQLEWRGRYAEFNLVYDRGTSFGLKTGGNIDAILMILPLLASWSGWNEDRKSTRLNSRHLCASRQTTYA